MSRPIILFAFALFAYWTVALLFLLGRGIGCMVAPAADCEPMAFLARSGEVMLWPYLALRYFSG